MKELGHQFYELLLKKCFPSSFDTFLIKPKHVVMFYDVIAVYSGVSGNSRSRTFPRMEASDSLSRTLGMDFFIPFPFPNFGNGFFSFPSRSRILGMGFFHSLPIPEIWEWIFLFPSRSRISGMGFFNSLPVPEFREWAFSFPSRSRTLKSLSRSPLLHLHEMEIGHLCLFVPREPSVPANSPGRNKKAFFFSSIFFSCGRNTSLTSDYAHCTKLKYISSFKRKRNNTVMLMYSKQNLFFTAKHWGGVCVCGGGVSKCL